MAPVTKGSSLTITEAGIATATVADATGVALSGLEVALFNEDPTELTVRSVEFSLNLATGFATKLGRKTFLRFAEVASQATRTVTASPGLIRTTKAVSDATRVASVPLIDSVAKEVVKN